MFIQGVPIGRRPGLGWLWFESSTIWPSCPATSAKFPSAREEFARQGKTQSSINPTLVYVQLGSPAGLRWHSEPELRFHLAISYIFFRNKQTMLSLQESVAREDGWDAGCDAVLRGLHARQRARRHGHHGRRRRQGSEPRPRPAGTLMHLGTLQKICMLIQGVPNLLLTPKQKFCFNMRSIY